MKKLFKWLAELFRGLIKAVKRFPVTVMFLLFSAMLISYMIYIDSQVSLIIQKLVFVFLFGAVTSAVAQTAIEGFELDRSKKITLYSASVIITLVYYLLLMPAPSISMEVAIRTFVAIFGMICAFVYIPSHKTDVNFDEVLISHFKSIFISILYSLVLMIGTFTILGASDTLLFNIDSNIYAYTAVVIWILFASIYYLSLLPEFSSNEDLEIKNRIKTAEISRFLEILISYIAVPLIAAFTLVLLLYFAKILFTFEWPIGELATITLSYSAVGIFVYLLTALIENKFTKLYKMYFPKILILIVIMQFISIGIRVNAYGITESRYYVMIFALYSMITAIVLTFRPRGKNGVIVLLAATFAIISVVPPIDTFTISRVSQTIRLEYYLTQSGILENGVLTAKTDVDNDSKHEITSILQYLENRDYTDRIDFLPKDFEYYNDMEKVIGFEAYYKNSYLQPDNQYKYANLGQDEFIALDNYDIMIRNYFPSYNSSLDKKLFNLNGNEYLISTEKVDKQDLTISITDVNGTILIGSKILDKAILSYERGDANKDLRSLEDMSFEVENAKYKMKFIFYSLNINAKDSANYDIMILFDVK
ncbi:MAG: DUF4153 domain-containing protein [Acidaminobacteraceae bacterium]